MNDDLAPGQLLGPNEAARFLFATKKATDLKPLRLKIRKLIQRGKVRSVIGPTLEPWNGHWSKEITHNSGWYVPRKDLEEYIKNLEGGTNG